MNRIAMTLLLVLFLGHEAYAAPRIVVLDFELNDITSLPNIPAELQRTAAMAPLLRQALSGTGEYQIVSMVEGTEKSAYAGVGYLFRHHDAAAQLGRQLGADWIIVSQHSKPSFLFSYLRTHLVRVKDGTLLAAFDIELKGSHTSVTERGIKRLAGNIGKAINERVVDAP